MITNKDARAQRFHHTCANKVVSSILFSP
jgi:hypothetical protein